MGGFAVMQYHNLAENLIETLGRHEMELILPKGTSIWKSIGSQSTLDLNFLSMALEDTVMRCHTAESLDASSDHIPINTTL